MHVKITTTAHGFEDWFIQVDVEIGTTVAKLKEVLAAPPHGLAVTRETKVLKKLGAALLSLQNTDKVTKDTVLLNFEPGPKPSKLGSGAAAKAAPTVVKPVRVIVRTSLNDHGDWKVEVDLLPSTTIAQLREVLARAPHELQLTGNRAMKRANHSLSPLDDHEPVTTEVVFQDFVPPGTARGGPQEPTRMLVLEEKMNLHQRMEQEKEIQYMISPAERRALSWPRTMAWALGQMQLSGAARRGTKRRPFVWWILGATNEVELPLAEAGAFDHVNFLDRQPCEVVLLGDNIRPFENKTQDPDEGETPRIRACPWASVEHWPDIPKPDLNVILCKGEAVAEWWRGLYKSRQMSCNKHLAQNTILSLRHRVNEDLMTRIARTLDSRLAWPVFRNPWSALAGKESAEYDDNGWCMMVKGLQAVVEVASVINSYRAGAAWEEDDDRPKVPATFWGIIDLKYDPTKRLDQRVKVLETGDGRSSRFSHAGAEIPKRFKAKYKLEEGANAGKHAVVSANKKLTHDLMELYGYGHLVPKQACCPRVYDPGLAGRIIAELEVSMEELVVLKLCNRSRAAGVMPVPAGELDNVLKEFLQPPPNFEDWLARKLGAGMAATLKIDWGCYEETVRHWWSNECPHFVAENFCTSMLTVVDGKEYDGTMRIAFAISRNQQNDSKGQPNHGKPNNPLLEFSPPAEELEVEWIGGYWKLPKEDVDSINIRASVISAARTAGTAVVDPVVLAEVYASMGDSVQQLFGGSEPSPKMLADRYNDQPELATYLTARLAIAMRELSRVRVALKSAKGLLESAPPGPAKSAAASFVSRGFGILEATTPPYKWSVARDHFVEAVAHLPANATALYLLGMAELELGNTEEAVKLMEKSLLLDLDFKAPYVNLGVAYLRTGKYEEAIKISEALLKRHPESPQCHYHIGVACYQKAYRLENTNVREAGKTKELADLKARALSEMVESRECEEGQRLTFRGIRGGPGSSDSPWLDVDEQMIEALKKARPSFAGASGRLPAVTFPDNIGWRFYGWRN